LSRQIHRLRRFTQALQENKRQNKRQQHAAFFSARVLTDAPLVFFLPFTLS
jgi:hypothetical protein